MKLPTIQLRRLRTWPVVYVLFVLMALANSNDAHAGDERDFQPGASMDTAAELGFEESRWLYTKSVRLELLKRDHVRVETTIPLHRDEESRLTLAMTHKLARDWSVNLSLWTSL